MTSESVNASTSEMVVIPNPSPSENVTASSSNLPTPSPSVSSNNDTMVELSTWSAPSPETFSVNFATPDIDSPEVTKGIYPSVEMSMDPLESGEVEDLDVDGFFSCFPRSAEVELMDGSVKLMKDVRIGDSVHVGDGQFSPVIMFTHQDDDARTWFVRVITDDNNVLVASAGHYVYANGQLMPMRKIRVGDAMQVIYNHRRSDGASMTVRSVSKVRGNGLYNPQTASGDIVVNGFKSSCYTEAVQVNTAHALLLPIRLLRRVWLWTVCPDQ